LCFFWMLTLFFCFKAIQKNKTIYWFLGGLSFGFSCLSKYNGFLLGILILSFLIFTPEKRHYLKSFYPYLAFFIGLFIFSPVIIWNAKNNWASFIFQFFSRHNKTFSISRFFQFIGSQMVYLSPLVFVASFKGWGNLLKQKHWHFRFLVWVSLPIFLIFAINSFFSSFKPHWPMLGYIGGIIGFCINSINKDNKDSIKKIIKYFKISLTISLVLIIISVLHTFYPILPIPPKKDITNDLYGWKKVANEIERIDVNEKFFITHRYQHGAPLSFALKKEVYVLWKKRVTHYSFFQDEKALLGRNFIYVTNDRYFKDPKKIYKADRIFLLKTIPIFRAGKKVRTFFIYEGRNYKGIR